MVSQVEVKVEVEKEPRCLNLSLNHDKPMINPTPGAKYAVSLLNIYLMI